MSDEMRGDGHLPATKSDLRGFATKADLGGFATKADLGAFATKADLGAFATKADVADLATKLDMDFATKAEMNSGFRAVNGRLDGHDANLRRLNISFARLEGDMTELKAKVGVIAEDFAWVKSFLERMNGNIEAALR